jgi:drug/metabolite transporter (DMT)-like permease
VTAEERAIAAPSAVPARQQRAALAMLVSILMFGLGWPINKVALAGSSPLWFACARAVLSTLASFTLVLWLRQLRRPALADLPIILSVGLLQLAAYFTLTNEALQFLPAGRSGVLASTTTLWLVPLALLTHEPIPRLRWIGAILGLGGIVILANPWSLDWHDGRILIGHGFLLLAALSWALTIFHLRRHRWHLLPVQALPWQMLVASLVLIALAALLDPDGGITTAPTTLGGLFFIGALAGPLGSWGAVIASRDLPTVATSLGFLGIPALGLLVSTSLMGEPVTWSLVLGAALIAAGVALATLASQMRETR